jgi:hypothetical protein
MHPCGRALGMSKGPVPDSSRSGWDVELDAFREEPPAPVGISQATRLEEWIRWLPFVNSVASLFLPIGYVAGNFQLVLPTVAAWLVGMPVASCWRCGQTRDVRLTDDFRARGLWQAPLTNPRLTGTRRP